MNGNLKRVMAAFLSFAMVASTPIQYVQAADEETATKAAESEAAVSEASEAKEESLPTLDDAIKSENPIDIYKDTGEKFLKGLTDEESYKYMILVRYNLTEKIQKDRQSLNEDIEKYVDISKNWTDRKPECKTEEETKQLDEQLAKWEDEISVSLGEKEYIKDEKTVKTSDSKSYHEYLAAITKIDAKKCLKLLSDITDAQNDEELTKAKEAFVDFNESVYGFDEKDADAEETKSDEKTINSAVPSVANVAGTTLEYEAHVANKGWMGSVSEGQTAGTTGQNLQLEAFTIAVKGNSNLNISYSAFQQDSGWQAARTSGQVAGTGGQNKRVEAIKMHLTGADADKYDIYYRVHATNFGWMGWAKNGEVSGSVGYKYAVQAFQITIVQKGSSAPGTTTHHFDTRAVARVGSLYYDDYASALNAVGDGGTVYLVRNATTTYGVTISKNVTITPDVGAGENGYVTLSKTADCKTDTNESAKKFFFGAGSYTTEGTPISRNTVIIKGNINFDGANTLEGSATGLLYCNYGATLKVEQGVNIYNSHQFGINSSGKLIINGANIHDNYMAGVGCWGNLRIYNSNIYNNNKSLNKATAGTAGGIHVNISDANSVANRVFRVEEEYVLEIENCNIYKNRNGINVFNKSKMEHPITCTIKNSSIHDNWVDGILTTYGGGAYFAQEVTANIENTTFSNNNAMDNMGGGIYNLGNLTIRNSSINGSSIKANKAQGSQGGGIYNKGTLTLENTALSDNIANYGSAVYQNGTFNASGSKTGTGNNDVYLPKDKYVTVTGALSNKIVVTPNEYKNGRVIAKITHDSKIGSLDYDKFTLTPNGNYVLRPGDSVTNVANDTIIVSTPYTISYDANGGSGAPSSTTKYWNEASALSNTIPVRPGYAFTYWTTNADGSGARYNAGANIPYDANANLKLYAQWKASQYTNTLIYNANGGSGAPASQTTTVTVPNTRSTFTVSSSKPTRTGYTFAGWYDAASGGNKIGSTVTVGSNSNTGNQSRTIYAHWTANQYTNTLSYNANGGSGAPDSQTTTVTFPNTQSTFTVSSTKPTRTGYTFAGWYDAATDGNKIGSTVTVGSSSNAGNQSKTIYAHWTANQYTNTLIYNANGGSGAPASQTATVTFPNTQSTFTVSSTKPTRTGYTFAGWYDAATGGNKIGSTVTVGSNNYVGNQSKAIYAHWIANQYTVSYDANGGTGSMSTDTVIYGTNYTTKANAFTRTGYTFIGWNEKADGTGADWTNWIGKPWNWSYTKNITLYAQWKINSYTLTITGDEGVEKITGSGTYTYGTTVPATYKIKTGYHLVKTTGTTYEGKNNGVWTGHANKEGTINDTWNIGTCNRTIVVHTAPNTYTISYNGNGSTGGSTASSSHSYDTAKNLTKNGYTKDGYTFKNWNTKANGTGTSYSDQESVKNLTSTNGGIVTLYAQWTPNTYTVSFNGNGATAGTMSSQAYVFDTAKALSANRFSRAYTVSFNTNGGTINSSSTATATAKFNGWEDRNNYVREGVNYSYTSFDAPYYANTYNDLMNAYGYNKYRLLSHYVLYGKNEGRNPKGSSAGLYPNSATVNNLTTTNKGTVTLYANWTLGSVTLPTPSRTGYIFDGWYDANENKIPGSTYTPTGNTTITAHWTAIKYTVTYNSNKPSTASGSVTGTTASSKHTYDTAQNLTANGYKLTGWTFTGWNTKQDGKGTAYKDKESVKNLTSENGKTITLYAQWRPNTYTVVYNGNSATGGNTANSSHVYDVAKNLNKNGYTKDNHTFVGWSNGSGTEYKDQQSVKNLTATDKGTVTLYAKWDKAPELTSEKQEYYEGETVTRDMLLSKVKANDREDGDISKKVIITKLAYPAGKLVNGKKQAAYEKSWTTGMPETEKLDTWFMQLDKKDAPVTIKMTCKVTDKVGNITEKTFDVLLKYNEFPTIDAEDRAFTWNEANAGLITEDALLKDQIAKGKLSAYDTEDGDVTNKIKILDYNEKDFTSLESSGTVAVTFSVTDKFGKETTRQVNIMIVKQDVLSDVEPVKIVRFINEKYYKKNVGINLKTISKEEEAERNQNGGLNVRSKWYTEDDYKNYINTVWNKTSGDTYTYTKSDLDDIKAYIDANGIGNAEKPNGLSGFVRTYMSDSFKD